MEIAKLGETMAEGGEGSVGNEGKHDLTLACFLSIFCQK